MNDETLDPQENRIDEDIFDVPSMPADVAEEPAEPETQRRGLSFVAWFVIILVAGTVVFLQHGTAPPKQEKAEGEQTQESLQLYMMELQGKYLVGVAQLDENQKKTLYQSAGPMNSGPVVNRLRFVVLAGELMGPKESLTQLATLQDKLKKSKREVGEIQQQLAVLYRDYDKGKWTAPSLDQEQKNQLIAELGWYGRLALTPKQAKLPERDSVIDATKWTVVTFIGITLAALVVGFSGFSALVIFGVCLFRGRIQFQFINQTNVGGIYAETFAVWMVLFLGLSVIASLAGWNEGALILMAGVFLLSLFAFAWPIARGISWAQVRKDIGWTMGKNPLIEVACGIATYVSTLPVLVLSTFVTIFLAGLQSAIVGGPTDEFEAAGLPAHPIVHRIADAGWDLKLQIMLLACVAAPIVEETMFRGVLYRHLRDASRKMRLSASIIFSIVINAFVFAVIHPQSLVAVPALMTLAAGFTIAREWRSSLIASMVAHGMNNGVVMLMLFTLL
ncbi:MAG: hypothetical protein CMJ78_23835 [Planctomycetaceae bacterium]|nr:hypothetical protein [Planctomycetaceae bacterium]